MPVQVIAGSHLTLHYRLSLSKSEIESGSQEDVMNTFAARPATLQLGIGQLAEPLERCLMGMTEGEHRVFELAEGVAFGQRSAQLLQRVSLQTLKENAQGESFEIGDLVDFPAPDGSRFAGVLKQLDEQGALFDFNHPLAGKALRFEVKLLGVL